MKTFIKPINNQNGSMILIAMMLIVILTIMGITSTSTSVIENRIAVNEQLHKMSLYSADSGLYTTAKIVGATVEEGDIIPGDLYDPGFEFAPRYEDDEDFYEYITDPNEYDDGKWDIKFELDNSEIKVDIELVGRTEDASGGIEIGDGVPIHALEITSNYRLFSRGVETHRGSVSTLSATYEKVHGDTEGL